MWMPLWCSFVVCSGIAVICIGVLIGIVLTIIYNGFLNYRNWIDCLFHEDEDERRD